MKEFIEYECENNQVVLRVYIQDEQIDEVWVGLDGLDEWTIVSYPDLLKALHKADLAIVKANRKATK